MKVRALAGWPAAALVALAGCSSSSGSDSIESDSGTSGASAASDSTPSSGGPGSGGSDSASGSTGEPLPDDCPPVPPNDYVDGLVHLGRAQGDTFIEILEVVPDDGIVFACTATQGLTVWDTADESQAQLLVENVGPAGLAHEQFPRCQHFSLDTATGRAVITNRGDEVQPNPWLFLYDVSNPAAPAPIRGYSATASIEGVHLAGDRLIAAAHSAGLMTFDLAQLPPMGEDLAPADTFADAQSDAWQIVMDGDLVYSVEGATGLRIYDIAGWPNITLRSTLALPGSSKDLILDGDRVFVASSSAVVGVDVSDPDAPTIVAERATKGTALDIADGADGVLVVAEWDEIRGYDRNDPELSEVFREVVPTSDDFSRVLALGADAERDRVYAGEWTGMHVFAQQSQPRAPDIFATPATVQFGQVAPGEVQDRVIVVRNEGEAPLVVSDIISERAVVSADRRCFEVEPGGAVAVEARIEPESVDLVAGDLIFETNDPDEDEYRVLFSVNAFGIDVGDPGPEFSLADLDGNTWTQDDLQGRVTVLAYFATF